MDSNEKPSRPVVWLSIVHVVYLMVLPVLANITIAPVVYHHTINAVFWAIFGLLGMPLAFAGMMSLNPFPRDFTGAVMRTFLLPMTAGLWWWHQQGTLLEYFAVMLVYEFLAIYLSIFLMSFIPLKYYDLKNPKAGNTRTYYNILVFQGFIAAGGFAAALVISMWPWASDMPFWHHPITYLLLLLAAIEYIITNFRWHKENSSRWDGGRQIPAFVDPKTVSIEGILLLSPIPWLISVGIINSGL